MLYLLQDFITGGYLLTHKDTFIPRSEVHRFVAALLDVTAKRQVRIDLPPPAIIKPVELWTGKQVLQFFNFIIFL